MKKKIITLITTLSLFCLVACSNENKENNTTNVGAGSNQEAVKGTVTDEPSATPVVEATAEPTTEPSSEVVDATAESTEAPVAEATPEPIIYEGIDMKSELSGTEWIETFVGLITEPKIVVYSDETGRKQIVEKKEEVVVNPDTDIVAIYLPEGYKKGDGTGGLSVKEVIVSDHSYSYVLDSEKTRNTGSKIAGIVVEYEEEEMHVIFTIIPE